LGGLPVEGDTDFSLVPLAFLGKPALITTFRNADGPDHLHHVTRKASPMAKAAVAPEKPFTKSKLLGNIAAATELSQKQVAGVLEALM